MKYILIFIWHSEWGGAPYSWMTRAPSHLSQSLTTGHLNASLIPWTKKSAQQTDTSIFSWESKHLYQGDVVKKIRMSVRTVFPEDFLVFWLHLLSKS
jgi:hypothetical protein